MTYEELYNSNIILGLTVFIMFLVIMYFSLSHVLRKDELDDIKKEIAEIKESKTIISKSPQSSYKSNRCTCYTSYDFDGIPHKVTCSNCITK